MNLSEVVAAMSIALDITEGQPEGHAAKSCLIAMRIAEELGLSSKQRSSLFYGNLLKDAGCSSNAAKVCSLFQADDREIKRRIKTTDWRRKKDSLAFLAKHAAANESLLARASRIVSLALSPNEGTELFKTRCSRGADIVRKLGFGEEVAEIIQGLDEHWDGNGEPQGLRRDQIPMLARIACLAQTVEVFLTEFGLAGAVEVATKRSGTWFDPELVQALMSFQHESKFWNTLAQADVASQVAAVEPDEHQLTVDDNRMDRIAEGFADVVDAKSPWTYKHSQNVAEVMVGGLQMLGYSQPELRYWRRAGLLHDIGKLGVSNTILDKPGRLTDEEFDQVKQHTVFTARILKRVTCFRDFADIAAAHHERIDGKGYHLGLSGDRISMEARVMAVADVFDALSAKRPYREKHLDQDEVFAIIDKGAGTQFCPQGIEAVKAFVNYSQ